MILYGVSSHTGKVIKMYGFDNRKELWDQVNIYLRIYDPAPHLYLKWIYASHPPRWEMNILHPPPLYHQWQKIYIKTWTRGVI